MEVPFTTTEDGGIITTSNNMNSKINKRFAQLPENLRLNGVTPSGKPRLFVCDTCTRAFARQEHLIRHKRSHTNEKPYICGICNRRFSRRDLLLRHAHKLHGGNCGDMLGRKGSAVAAVAASAHSSSGRRRLNSVVSKRRRAAAATAAAADGEGVLVTSSPSMTAGSSGRSSVASVRVCKSVVKRRISFSAQSGDNYASAGSLDGPAPIKGDKVQFSTPQLLPVDLTQELSAFTPVDANSWVNDVNSISLEAVAMTGADSSGSTVTSARHSTSSISWQSGRMKSLFNNTPFQPKGVAAAAAAATTAAGAGHSMATGQALGPADWQAGVDSRSPTATSLFNGATNNSSESHHGQGGHHKGRGSPSRSREMSDCSATNEFRFLCPTETADDDSKKKSNHDDNEEDDAHNDHRGVTTANDFLSTFDNFMQNGYSFYGMEVPDMANTIITSSAHPAVAAAASSGASTVCTGRGSPATSTVHCSFFTQELRAMCINALEYYSLYCVKPGTSIGSSVSVPSCRELNLYLSLFVDHFTCHSPFVHPQLWQSDLATFRGYIYGSLENASMADDRVVQYSNIVCLPLFTATMGSLYADARGTRSSAQDGANAQAGAGSTSAFSSSSRAEQMYEISRRVLHVYLDTRNSAKLPSSSNLWLTQSLTLSILYSLFLESWHEISEKHSNTLLKQVNAVCTMVRKDLVPTTSSISQVPHFACQAQYIFFESKIRTIIHCYNICQMLKCFYNIKSTTFLKESDLDPLLIPDDEPTWNSAALCFHIHTDPNSILPTTSTTREKKNTMQFGKFYQTFTFSTLGAHVIPEFLTKAMLYYEFNNNSNYSFHIFLTKIDTKKLELNLRFYGGNLSGSGNVTPTSVSSDNSMPTAYNSHLQLDPTKSLSQDAVVLKNTLMCIIFFNSINPGLGWQMGCQSVDLIFETYLDSNKFNILAHGSYKLITDFLVALNFSIQNISSVIQTSQAPIFDVSRISVLNLQCYYFNFLVIIKFIMDFECTPNFKLLCIYTELKKLANSFYIPVLSSFYPLEFAKFLDSDMELLNLWKSGGAGSPSNYYHQDHQDCRLDGATASSSNTVQHINVSQLEKLINNVLVYSFNDSNFLSMPENGCNQFAFYSDPSNQSSSSNNNNHTLPMSPPSPSPRPTASSLNLLKYHQESHRTGKRLKQSFTERYHLAEKYIIIAKCIFLHAHESYVHSNFLKGFSDNFQSLERLLSKRDNNHNNNENNNNSDYLHQGNQENDNNGGVSAADGLLLMDHGSTLSGVKPSSLFSNHISN